MQRSVCLLLALAALPAWADSSSTVTLSNPGFTLVDLDPGDGIASTIAFNQGSNYASGSFVSLYEFPRTGPVWDDEPRARGNSPLGSAASVGQGVWSTGAGSVSGNGTLGGTLLQASGQVLNGPIATTSEADYFAGATILRDANDAYTAQSFTLAPHTRVEFSAQADLFAQIAYPGRPVPPQGDVASATAGLLVFDVGALPYTTGPRFMQDERSASVYAAGSETPLQQTLSVWFENSTDQPLDGAVGFDVEVYGRAVGAVPEPASLTSLAAGLLLLGWQRRRRGSARGWGSPRRGSPR